MAVFAGMGNVFQTHDVKDMKVRLTIYVTKSYKEKG